MPANFSRCRPKRDSRSAIALILTHWRSSVRWLGNRIIRDLGDGPINGHGWLKFLLFIAFALIVAAAALSYSLHRP